MIKSADMVSTGSITYRADGSAHDTAIAITDRQIEALRAEARRHGDDAQVLIARMVKGEWQLMGAASFNRRGLIGASEVPLA